MQSATSVGVSYGRVLRSLCVMAPFAALCAAHAQSPQNDQGDGKKISGLGVIIRVDSPAPEPLLQADGYRIRIAANTATAFNDPLKSLTDVGPNTWIKFEGALGSNGALVATKAEFFPAGYHRNFTLMGPRKAKKADDYKPVTKDSLIDAQGNFVNAHTKVRYSDAGGPCGWHRVPADAALQERVKRIGKRVTPAYQSALTADNPARIPFRFYAVADDKVRSVFACNLGLVLVPSNVVERLQKDDQLAAVLADGVAFNLQRQLFSMGPLEWSKMGIDVAMLVPPLGAAALAGYPANAVLEHEEALKAERQRARMALQLLADAGFDPKQAPEAWRLLQPKDLPADPSALKYPREGEYQLRVLKAMYTDAALGPDAAPPSPSAADPDPH